jgi:LPS sulfotransferase NodH
MINIKNPKTSIDYSFGKAPKASHLQLFEDLASRPDNTRPMEKSLLILCTPRCGSTLFSEALNSCGRLGLCEEWFNYDYFNAYITLMGGTFNLTEYMNFITRKSLRDTGVFCLKLHIGQLIQMNQDYDMSIESLDFDHIIYLYRRDKIAQAVSLCKASSSGQYRSYEEEQNEAKTTRHAIASCLETVVKFDWFARKYLLGYVDESFAYEDFCRLKETHKSTYTLETQYAAVLKALGKLEGSPLRFTTGKLKKQGNQHSKRATDDFRSYLLGEKV